jgi:hypothetical protein
MKFPVGILPSAAYTLLYVARYNGINKRRIFQGVVDNWMSGFYNGLSGVSLHSFCGWISQSSNDVHGSDWVVSADRSNSYRSNGVDRTTNTNNNCAAYDRLAINTGYSTSDSSDFAIQTVLVYNGKLTDADVISLETWIVGNTSCSAGQVFTIGTFSCTPCPVGMYKNASGGMPCTGCPPGMTTASQGSVSQADCICSLGMYPAPGGLTCTGCPPGWTTASQGSVSQADCSIFVSPTPPIVSGLVAYYTADSWNSSSKRWIDLSGAGNHVTEVGGATAISVLHDALVKADAAQVAVPALEAGEFHAASDALVLPPLLHRVGCRVRLQGLLQKQAVLNGAEGMVQSGVENKRVVVRLTRAADEALVQWKEGFKVTTDKVRCLSLFEQL